MGLCILVLEDNAERRAAMRARVAERLPMYELILTDDPGTFIGHLRDRGSRVLVVSLDHDLHERADQSTDLTGMQVVDHLVRQEPAFPVLLHTTNERDGARMEQRLKRGGWSVTWVKPFADTEWVNLAWYPALKRAVRCAAPLEPVPESDDRD